MKKVKYTEKQQEKVKDLVRVAEQFADHLLLIMKNHELDKINGCRLTISVDPEMLFATERVIFGTEDSDAGIVNLSKGRRCRSEQFEPFDRNSPEYELLFGRAAVAERIRANATNEKPLPPDGLWISADGYGAPVDDWWDVK